MNDQSWPGYRRSQQKCEGQTQSDGMLTPPFGYRLSSVGNRRPKRGSMYWSGRQRSACTRSLPSLSCG
jgi:hypothetical protein